MFKSDIRLLFVEDDKALGEALTEVLTADGFKVEWVKTPKEAIQLVQRLSVHAIVSDIMLPQMSGVDLLKEIKPFSRNRELLFPSDKKVTKPISENTMTFALYRMGYKNRATAHGFRATASSILNEEGFNRDAIERQLAHQERNKVRGAYTHHAQYPLKTYTKM